MTLEAKDNKKKESKKNLFSKLKSERKPRKTKVPPFFAVKNNFFLNSKATTVDEKMDFEDKRVFEGVSLFPSKMALFGEI